MCKHLMKHGDKIKTWSLRDKRMIGKRSYEN